MAFRRWTEHELKILTRRLGKDTYIEIGKRLGRTLNEVRNQVYRMGLRSRKQDRPAWTRTEVAALWRLAEGRLSRRQAAKQLGRSEHAVIGKAKALGIRWTQARVTLVDVANEVGCSPGAVRRLVHELWPDNPPCHDVGLSRRYHLSWEQAEHVAKLMRGRLRGRRGRGKSSKISAQMDKGSPRW